MQGFDLSTISDAYVGGTQVSAIYYYDDWMTGASLIWPINNSEYVDKYFTIESLEDNNEISFGWYSGYANQGRELRWTTYENATDLQWEICGNLYNGEQRLIRVLNKGEKIYFKANYVDWNRNQYNDYNYTSTSGAKLDSSKKVRIYGNISSLIEGKPVIKSAKRGIQFIDFFRGLNIVDAANLYINVTLSKYSFFRAFLDRRNMIYPPARLYPNRMYTSCYYSMFDGCTSLVAAPELPATTLAESCYENMFAGCTSLTIAPDLPAPLLAKFCYQSMFFGCTSLTTPPALTAERLADGCYRTMFTNCTALTTAPLLTFMYVRVNYNPCEGMFSGCTSLNSITCLYNPAFDYRSNFSTYFTDWVKNVAPNGNFYIREGVNWDIGDSGIPYGWSVTDSQITKPLNLYWYLDGDFYITNTINEFAYSLDNCQTWSILQPDTHITMHSGDTVYLLAANRLNGNKPTVTTEYGIGSIIVTGNVGPAGNVMSLLTGTYDNEYNRYAFDTMQEIPQAYQFKGLFGNINSGALHGPWVLALPATILKEGCYMNMFTGNYYLSGVPKLPALKMEKRCYDSMFAWTNISEAPNLPAMTLAESCYSYMFSGCWALTSPPVLPATTLAYACYYSMFSSSAITSAPVLPATTLDVLCYREMFRDCTSLVSAPSLPATTLEAACYANMFEGCTSLTTAPDLPAPQLGWECYREMFKNCSSLNSITCMALDLGYSEWNSTTDWVDGVAASGTFTKQTNMQNWTTGVNGIPSGWTVTNEIPSYFTIESISNNNDISYQSNVNNTFEYSTDDGLNWATWAPNTNVTLNNGDRLLVRGTNPTVGSTYGIGTFNATNYFNVSGNIMSLVSGSNYENATTVVDYQFAMLFYGNTYLRNAQSLILPATTLADWCYYRMFQGCTSLITAPSLPATTLDDYCYCDMFYSCTSLTTAPVLPATTLAGWCYSGMFYGCTSLTTAPSLPATTLESSCYQSMFSGCTSLTTAPELPATTLASSCYQYMFNGCTSLTTAPSLPATTLDNDCYRAMFYGCTSLTTAPSLPATTLASSCYQNMFNGCTSLTTAPELPATTLGDYCYAYMFDYCISLTTAPSTLPATTLANYCYAYMFRSCRSLLISPELPATTLVAGCYNYMFQNCRRLHQVTCLATSGIGSLHGCTTYWLDYVASNGTFIKAATAYVSDWGRGVNGIPQDWTVQNAS